MKKNRPNSTFASTTQVTTSTPCPEETEVDLFIKQNRNRRVEDIALELSRNKRLDATFILRQIEGWQRMHTKVPRWAEVEGIHYPPRLSLEQCSGQAAAEYKAQLVKHLCKTTPTPSNEPPTSHNIPTTTFCDLTGGMGIDFSFIAPLYNTRTYVEQRPELVEAARHNFPLLGLADAHIVHGNAIDHLQAMPPHDLIFIDPARRDTHGAKTILIEDCEPNIVTLLHTLLSKCKCLLVKLSPMLDLHRAIATLHNQCPGCVNQVHIFSAGGECKELLLVIHPTPTTTPTIHCSDETTTFSYTLDEEANATIHTSTPITGYLYEPNHSIMKAGAFKTLAKRYQLTAVQANSHLFFGKELIENFPGRKFKISYTTDFSKKGLKKLTQTLNDKAGKANLTIRNFPTTVADLRKRLKIKEGGDLYLFATTDCENHKIIIVSQKA